MWAKVAKSVLSIVAASLFVSASAEARDHADPLLGTPNGLAQTPPMGWNSWNKFGCNVNESLIRGAADAMVTSGLKDAGYSYIVIDDCWQGARDANGNIQPDAKKFPSGMKTLGDYIHAKGLKFGIYSDAGAKTCGGFAGSRGHEFQDAAQYAAWGVDYLKYDWCNTDSQDAPTSYLTMSQALQATGRPIVFSLCEWGNNKPWLWAKNIGNLWRTTGDIADQWDGMHPNGYSMGLLKIVDMQAELAPYAGPGHWNDPDMLEVGNGGMSDAEYRAHFSLWAMFAAPLMAGNDLPAMNAATKAILTNTEVITVDQDPLGVAASRVWHDGDAEIWARPLKGGGRAVVLFNRGKDARRIDVTWDALNYPLGLVARVRDLWRHQAQAPVKGSVGALVPSHAVVMLTIRP
jgi:alpha-galactosidase